MRLMQLTIFLGILSGWAVAGKGETTQTSPTLVISPVGSNSKPLPDLDLEALRKTCETENSLSPSQVQIKIQACKKEKHLARCDELEKSVADKSKLRDCKKIAACEEYSSAAAFAKACTDNWAGAWRDVFAGLFGGEVSESEEELVKRADFFHKCLDAQCKKAALGPYQSLFTEKQIGSLTAKEKQEILNSSMGDQRAIEKYRHKLGEPIEKLLNQLFAKFREGEKNGKQFRFMVPWTGKEVTSFSSDGPTTALGALKETGIQALKGANQFLDEIGIKNRACYDPIMVREMQCYAFFSIVDPALAAGAAIKIKRLAALTKKVKPIPNPNKSPYINALNKIKMERSVGTNALGPLSLFLRKKGNKKFNELPDSSKGLILRKARSCLNKAGVK